MTLPKGKIHPFPHQPRVLIAQSHQCCLLPLKRSPDLQVTLDQEQARSVFPFDVAQITGDEGVRTPDPVVANHVLSQLSYIPVYRVQLDDQWVYLDSNQGPQLYQSCALAN